jgi:AraC family transcriptional regulator of adaptative response/methylated-DNA-[protein]-cysteine methyltransferase
MERVEAEMTETIRYARGDSSLGAFLAAVSDRGVAMVAFADRDGAAAMGALRERFPDADLVEDGRALSGTLAVVAGAIDHPEKGSDLSLDLRGTPFERRVWQALRDVPAGETVSYGDLAARIGAPGAARDVADACAANALAVLVPCHRVVKKSGSIAGYRWGFRRKRALIEREHAALFRLC